MVKKRCSRSSRKAQITIFIIAGLLILFIFLFLFLFMANVKKSQLELQGEDVFTKSFRKEALRIFVDTCLKDGLEEGLVLLSKQGRLWHDQPGGRTNFEEGVTGTHVPEENPEEGGRVFYGVTRENYAQSQFTYPCDAEDPALPCVYHFPNTTIGFGEREFRLTDFQNDLRKFLIERTVECVQEFTLKNVSRNAQFETTEIDLKLTLNDDLISASVNYPLKFRVGGEEYFHLSQFDFFYPTRIKQLLDAAVIFPLGRDQKYVDFGYNSSTLQSDVFIHANEVDFQYADCSPVDADNDGQADYYECQQSTKGQTYRDLGVKFEPRELSNGDDLFTFTPAERIIVDKPGEYPLRIARQNRPPALEYVNRSQCLAQGYDYLVIIDDDVLGEINIKLSAQDADEDGVNYRFIPPPGWLTASGGQYFIDKNTVNNFIPNRYILKAQATDGFLTDEQDIRILVDRPIQSDITLDVPYQLPVDSSGTLQAYQQTYMGRDHYTVSLEDPIVIDIFTPPQSVGATDEEVKLVYTVDGEFVNGFQLPNRHLLQGNTFSHDLPRQQEQQSNPAGLENYGGNAIQLITDRFQFPFRFFDQVTDKGLISLEYNVNYCGEKLRGDTSAVNVKVAQCIPHQDLQHPFPYPYHTYRLDPVTGQYSQDTGANVINPFLATHSCCASDSNDPLNADEWKIEDTSRTCFTNPQDGCYGGIRGFTNGKGGYIVEHEIRKCDGRRGNTCEGQFERTLPLDTQQRPDLRCGSSAEPQCTRVHAACQGQKAWGYVDTDTNNPGNEGWCHGTLGCQNICQQEVVVDRANQLVQHGQPFDINQHVADIVSVDPPAISLTNDAEVQFHCGCQSADLPAAGRLGALCDGDFDGRFEGRCDAQRNCFPTAS